MSRKTKAVPLTIENDKGEEKEVEVIVKELTVKQVRRLLGSALSTAKKEKENQEEDGAKTEEASNNAESVIGTSILDIFGDEFREMYNISIKGLDYEDVEDLTPSQMKELYNVFYEVNSVFFETAQSLGIIDAIKGVLGSIKEDYLKEYVRLTDMGM